MAAITPQEARDYLDRWALVNAIELEELRGTSMELKLKQLASLMASRDHFPEDPASQEGSQAVLRRWARLREVLGA
jgi:hypothetical protein